jgi:pimeloyl-ACP methyl ester carboxylesterase
MKANQFVSLLIGSMSLIGCGSSQVFKSPAHEAKIMSIYDTKLAHWPVPFDTIRIRTHYGITYIIVSGPKEKPPLLLLHAMGVTSMMWIPTIDSLSRYFRIYAIDELGDIGKSVLYKTNDYLDEPEKYTLWLNEIYDSLGIQKANIVGASYGGWITLHYAEQAPRRVKKIALLGPMGISSVSFSVIWRLLMLMWFPTDSKKQDMIDWTLGNNPKTLSAFSEHMWTAMDCHGFMATPWELSDKQLKSITVPTLLLLGENDGPIGPPDEARERSEKFIRDVRVKVISNAGHMMNYDQPEIVNKELMNFFCAPDSLER